VQFHPVAKIFPLMSERELMFLRIDIEKNGQHETIKTYRGKIIDGCNRCKACLRGRLEPRFREWDGKGSLVAFVVSLNPHRRHMDSGQRAMAATESVPHLEAEAAERRKEAASLGGKTAGRGRPKDDSPPQKVGEGKHDGEAVQEPAWRFGTNRQYVSDAKEVKESDPELAEKVKSGEVSLKEAEEKRFHRRVAPGPRRSNLPWRRRPSPSTSSWFSGLGLRPK
jgi:hypothetical protein